MVRIILIMLTLILSTTNAYAEPDAPYDLEDLDLRSSIELDINTFNKRSYTRQPPKNDIMRHTTMHDWSHVQGAYAVKLIGIHSSILNQLQRRVTNQVEDDLRTEYNLSSMTTAEFHRRMSGINTEYNPYGNWWERSWLYSLPPGKGGAPKITTVKEIGWDLSIPDNFPVFGWFKKQFDNLGDIWISVDHEFDEERGPNPQRYDGKINNDAEHYSQLRIEETNIGIDKPWRWFESDHYHFRFKPIVKFTPSEDSAFMDEVAMKMQIDLFTDQKKHFATVNFFVRHKFEENNTFFSVFFELVNF